MQFLNLEPATFIITSKTYQNLLIVVPCKNAELIFMLLYVNLQLKKYSERTKIHNYSNKTLFGMDNIMLGYKVQYYFNMIE